MSETSAFKSKRLRMMLVGPLVIGVILTISFGTVLVVGSRTGNNLITRTVEMSGHTIITTESRSLFNAVYHLDITSVGMTLNRLVSDESIVYAAVRDKSGQRMSEATIGWEPERVILWKLASGALLQRNVVTKEIGPTYLGLSGPIAAGSQQIGTLEIVFDKTRQQALLKDAQLNLLAVLSLIFVGAVLIGIVLTRYATNPWLFCRS